MLDKYEEKIISTWYLSRLCQGPGLPRVAMRWRSCHKYNSPNFRPFSFLFWLLFRVVCLLFSHYCLSIQSINQERGQGKPRHTHLPPSLPPSLETYRCSQGWLYNVESRYWGTISVRAFSLSQPLLRTLTRGNSEEMKNGEVIIVAHWPLIDDMINKR